MEMDNASNDYSIESQSLSPQASTDEKSLHRNWQRNREALQKRLSIRRPVDDLVNNGIMMSPLKTPPCYAERMRQLERAKTTDILKQKIQHRPDAQSLVDRHILPEWPPDEIGGSPQVFEQQQMVRRTELMSCLNAKLEQRPGSLEMAEKGLLPLAPPMQTLLRDGSISYPRVDETVSQFDDVLEAAASPATPSFIPSPSPAPSLPQSSSAPSSCRRTRSRRSTGLGTSKVGNFVFHTYTPPSKSAAPVVEPPEEDPVTPNTAREIQQAEYLRLQESEDKQNVLMQQLVHDIRSRHDGGSPVKVKKAPNGPSFLGYTGLASLNVQQLKEECRRYKVPRTGNKLQLIRNLEPFQQEILRRYIMSAAASPAGQLGVGMSVEDQAIRHSSSAPQLNPGSREEVKTEANSPQQQWPQPTTVILLNQPGTGPMTLQSMILQPPIMASQPAPPPPPPPPPPSLLLQPQSHHHSQASTPEQIPASTPEVDEEMGLIQQVEELERQIVKNIQDSDSYKASHNGNRGEHIERKRQMLMINYTNTKRQAKLRLQERIDNAKQRLIELCEKEVSFSHPSDITTVEMIEREREVTLMEYNRLNGILDKLKANSTPNTSVSSETRVRSFTDSTNGNIPSIALNRSMTIGEVDLSRTYGQVNGTHNENMHIPKHVEKRLPSVEFQMLNEVLNQDSVRSKIVHPKTERNSVPECDLTSWLNEPTLPPYNHPHPQLNGCAMTEVGDLPMSPMQTDFSSRCSTPQRPTVDHQTVPTTQAGGEFNFEEFLCNPNMDITFPSLGGHPSAASMTEQILTPNTQSALYQFIQPDVVNMETDNDVFTP